MKITYDSFIIAHMLKKDYPILDFTGYKDFINIHSYQKANMITLSFLYKYKLGFSFNFIDVEVMIKIGDKIIIGYLHSTGNITSGTKLDMNIETSATYNILEEMKCQTC